MQYLHKEHIGVKLIMLAADPTAKEFYEKMEFEEMGKSYSMPKEGWSVDCIPMIFDLGFEYKNIESFIDIVDDEDDD